MSEKIEMKPHKYLIYVRYGVRPSDVPDWSWDLAYSGNSEIEALGKYTQLTLEDKNNQVVLTKQCVAAISEVA